MDDKSCSEGLTEDYHFPVLQRIGAGSFATVYISHGGACAYKVVHNPEDTEIIEKEFRLISGAYLSCNTDSFFRLPRAYAFYDSATDTLHVDPGRLGSGFTDQTFKLIGIANASYAMDRVFVLPLVCSQPIRELYYPASFKQAPPPTLCRLYFGKILDAPAPQGGRPPRRFFNSANFPIDRARYAKLAETLYLPDINEVVAGMGDMLARLNWRGNIDGRDIEWVLGGDGLAGISYFVIDFNQSREWGKNMAGVLELVTAFMSNDPYYPRPRPQDPLYQTFRTAYLDACPSGKDVRDVALMFLADIEKEQAKRDAPSAGPA